jgi:hypothetical protein
MGFAAWIAAIKSIGAVPSAHEAKNEEIVGPRYDHGKPAVGHQAVSGSGI